MVYTEDHLTIIADSVLQRAFELYSLVREFAFRFPPEKTPRRRRQAGIGKDDLFFYVDFIRRNARTAQLKLKTDITIDSKIESIAAIFFDIYERCIDLKSFTLENSESLNAAIDSQRNLIPSDKDFSERILAEVNVLMRSIATFFNDHDIQIDERQRFFDPKIAKETIIHSARLKKQRVAPIMFGNVDGVIGIESSSTFLLLPQNKKSAESVFSSLKTQFEILCDQSKYANIDPVYKAYIDLNSQNYARGFDSFNPIKADSDSLLLKEILPLIKTQSDSIFLSTAVIVSSQDRLFSQYEEWVEFKTRCQNTKLTSEEKDRVVIQSDEIIKLNSKHTTVSTHEAQQALKQQDIKLNTNSIDKDRVIIESNDISGNYLKEIARSGIDFVKEEASGITKEIANESKKATREAIKAYVKDATNRFKGKITTENKYIVEIFEWLKDLI